MLKEKKTEMAIFLVGSNLVVFTSVRECFSSIFLEIKFALSQLFKVDYETNNSNNSFCVKTLGFQELQAKLKCCAMSSIYENRFSSSLEPITDCWTSKLQTIQREEESTWFCKGLFVIGPFVSRSSEMVLLQFLLEKILIHRWASENSIPCRNSKM